VGFFSPSRTKGEGNYAKDYNRDHYGGGHQQDGELYDEE
jgi:hypothetical protein